MTLGTSCVKSLGTYLVKPTLFRLSFPDVKENIFNIINHSNFINTSIEKSNVLDLYSGIGSFGIECLSRGVRKVIFVENYNKVLPILKNNLAHLKSNIN